MPGNLDEGMKYTVKRVGLRTNRFDEPVTS